MATHWISCKPILKSAIKWTPKLLISHKTVTLNEGKDHQEWYPNVELTDLHYHTTFQRELVRKCRNTSQCEISFKQNPISRVFSLEYWMDDWRWLWGSSHQQVSLVYQIPIKSIENFVRNPAKKCLFSYTPVTLKQSQGQLDKYVYAENNSIYHHIKFNSNQFQNVWTYVNVTIFTYQHIKFESNLNQFINIWLYVYAKVFIKSH